MVFILNGRGGALRGLRLIAAASSMGDCMSIEIKLKRAYEPAGADDGMRILVDRLWPRGLSKAAAALTLWMKDIAPSTELREWFAHDPALWPEFQRRYRAELDANGEAVERMRDLLQKGPATLLYAAHDREHNQAVVLASYLQKRGSHPRVSHQRGRHGG
ncbi:conserved protein of unknown function [Methylocella tundrae]|uniref:Uroporphyrin-III C-methyltransferase n=2 Tax=Methylocella tundrae TaxID=227605 RepID=A0A4U8Z269_METTU|nr:conserved protein of unknown function [Methylocella tundrae]